MKYFIAFCLCAGGFTLQAQQAINTTAAQATGSNGTASYIVGQVAYITMKSSSGSVSQGVEQPYEISIVTTVEEASSIALTYSISPNPTSDLLKLTITSQSETLKAEMLNAQGVMVYSQSITGNETLISMTNLPASTYLLKLSNNKSLVKTFKIVKN
jgi:hypothetical protein